MKHPIAITAVMMCAAFAQESQEPIKIGPGVTRPKVLERVEPQYTEEAREAKLEGTVLLKCTIDIQGRTKDVLVLRGLGLGLDEKAVDALLKWRFEPARLQKNNTPVAVTANVEINFRLL